MKELMNTNEVRMNSLELCELINKFRKEEGNNKNKRHDNLLRDIDNEIKALQNVEIPTFLNFEETTYTDGTRNYRCYLLNKSGIMQILNKESAVVRFKTQLYIESLERKLKEQDIPSYQIEDKISRAKAWIKEEECRQQLYLENQELKHEVEELSEYKLFKSMLNNCIETDMLLGQFGQFLKSNTNIKTGQKLIFKYCKENGLVKLEYKENYATALAVNNGWFKNVGEYIDTKYGTKLVNKIMITKKGCLHLGKKLFNEYLENTLS